MKLAILHTGDGTRAACLACDTIIDLEYADPGLPSAEDAGCRADTIAKA